MGFLDKVKETSKQMGEKAQQLAEAGQDKFDDFKTDKQISASEAAKAAASDPAAADPPAEA
ncbi:MAG: hypothetical protein ACXW1M_05220 [Acidimicrobiia bacterium]